MLKVIKKDNKIAIWDSNKIRTAVKMSSDRVKSGKKITEEQLNQVIQDVLSRVSGENYIKTEILHEHVISALSKYNSDVCLEYKSFRKYKEEFSKAFKNTAKFSNKVVYNGDKENANKDSSLNSTKQALISEGLMKELMKVFEMKPEWMEAHEEGWIHIHDLGSRYLNQINCCLFNMGGLLDGGFEMNGSLYLEPKTIQTAWAVVGDVTLSASSQQYGGQQ